MNIATALQALVSILWIIIIGLIVVAVVRASRGHKVRGIATAILIAAVSAVILTIISAGLVFIQPEERGVVISAVAPKGYREQALQPGLNWIIPFLENEITYSIARQTYTMSIIHAEGDISGDDSILARTSDGQEVIVDASVIYAVDPSEVIKVHIEWQSRFSRDLVRPLTRGIIRDAISQFGVEEVYSTKRDEMTQKIHESMDKKLTENGLLLIDFVLRNITFSTEYGISVEQKQIAEQQAQQAAYVVEQRKQEAEQARQVAQGKADAVVINAEGDAEARIIQAQAEAEALEMIAQAVADNQDLINYLYINKINPGVQVMLMPNDVPFFYPLPTVGPPAPESPPLLPTPSPSPTPLPTPEPTATP